MQTPSTACHHHTRHHSRGQFRKFAIKVIEWIRSSVALGKNEVLLFFYFVSLSLPLSSCVCPFYLSVFVLFANPNAFHLFTFSYFVVILCIVSLFRIGNNEIYSLACSLNIKTHCHMVTSSHLWSLNHLCTSTFFPFFLLFSFIYLMWCANGFHPFCWYLMHIFILNFHHRIQSWISCTICCHSGKYIWYGWEVTQNEVTEFIDHSSLHF